MTAGTLIYTALRALRYMTPGQLNAPETLADGLAALNGLIDASNINRGNIASLQLDTWTLVPGTQKYTVGPGGVFNTARPLRISRANLLLTSGGSIVRRKLELLDDAQWGAKSVQAIAGMPIELYNDGAYPLSTYWFYLIPDQAYQFETYTWQQFAQLAALTTAIVIPQGYYEFWLYSLAMRLAGMFDRPLSDATVELYRDARAAVQALNAPSPRIASDGDLRHGGGGSGLYNWMDGLVSDE